MRIDLHSHTTESDGKLSPDELITHAIASGVDMLSITDHDSIEAYRQISQRSTLPFRLITGIEFSTQWLKTDVHILGLNVALDNKELETGITAQQMFRYARASTIADKLTRELGIPNPLEAVRALASNDHSIGRPHFARYLVQIGLARTDKEAFKKYLGIGKQAYVKPTWAELTEVIAWIRAAGGTAVLAHPARYKLTLTRLLKLVDVFIEAGGQGLEVVSGSQTPDVTANLAKICENKQLLASCGSDFHGHEQVWSRLGNCPPLPRSCEPVWSHWN